MTRLLLVRLLALSAASLYASSVLAEGPGTRIRSGSELPRLLESLPRDTANPCARLQGNARQRCLDEERKPMEGARRAGPHSTDMGSGAGATPPGGSGGAVSFGAGAAK